MLYLIGLGLNLDDLGKHALSVIKSCKKVYVEGYTVDFPYNLKDLEKRIGRFELLNRDSAESDEIVLEAKDKDICFLVYGSPLTATTHISLILTAKKEQIPYKILHNASIFDAAAESGLQIYKFGKTASMPDWEDKGVSFGFMEIYEENKRIKAHTLILVDIGLSFKDALSQLKKAAKEKYIKLDKLIICSKMGTEKNRVLYKNIEELDEEKIFPPFCFILPSQLHFLEKEFLDSLQ